MKKLRFWESIPNWCYKIKVVFCLLRALWINFRQRGGSIKMLAELSYDANRLEKVLDLVVVEPPELSIVINEELPSSPNWCCGLMIRLDLAATNPTMLASDNQGWKFVSQLDRVHTNFTAAELEFFVEHPELAPDWLKQAGSIVATDVVYLDARGNQYSRANDWDGYKFAGYYIWLGDRWFTDQLEILNPNQSF